jgi:microcystin degradation protein MlrC
MLSLGGMAECQVLALEQMDGVVSASLLWGNPFTDVPELCSQVLVLLEGNAPDSCVMSEPPRVLVAFASPG